MAENMWNIRGVPHRGWQIVDVIDLRANGEILDDSEYAVCQMCGNEKIRYIHIMSHQEYDRHLEVGCICAEKMSGDYKTPREREAVLRNRSERRRRWLKRKWRVSASGNDYLKIKGWHIVVFPLFRGGWSFRIDGQRSRSVYETSDGAKLAVFDKYCDLSQDGKIHLTEEYY